MSGSHAGLLPHQSGHHFEFLAIHIAVSIQIEHSEGNLKVATGNFKINMVIIPHSKVEVIGNEKTGYLRYLYLFILINRFEN